MPCDPDPAKLKEESTGEVAVKAEEQQDKNSEADLDDQGSGPVYTEGNKRQGPHTQQRNNRIKSQLTLEFVSEKTLHFSRNLQ